MGKELRLLSFVFFVVLGLSFVKLSFAQDDVNQNEVISTPIAVEIEREMGRPSSYEIIQEDDENKGKIIENDSNIASSAKNESENFISSNDNLIDDDEEKNAVDESVDEKIIEIENQAIIEKAKVIHAKNKSVESKEKKDDKENEKKDIAEKKSKEKKEEVIFIVKEPVYNYTPTPKRYNSRKLFQFSIGHVQSKWSKFDKSLKDGSWVNSLVFSKMIRNNLFLNLGLDFYNPSSEFKAIENMPDASTVSGEVQ